MADIRSSTDDALPAPQQSQPLQDGFANMSLGESSVRPTSMDQEKSAANDGSSGEKRSSEGDSPSAPQPAPQLSASQGPPTPSPAEVAMQKNVHEVLISDIGIATLLNRLKQSIASAKEFATFLKKRAVLEDDQAQSLKKLCRLTQENMRRSDHRQGSFAQSYDEMMFIHERMAENGIQFAASLHQMHEDLVDLSGNAERGRKMWKSNGLSAEQKVADLDQTMRKSKAKYDSLAEEYERARTGEGRHGGKVLGAFKAHKSAAQQEEDLLKKVQAADQTYHNHVQTLQAEKSQLESSTRPEAVKAIQDIVNEVDSALTLQMQKFAAFNEKLLLGNGMIVYPFKNQPGDSAPQPRSLRQAVSSINNERDLNDFISSQHSKVQLNLGEVKYEKNPVLSQNRPVSQPFSPPGASGPQSSFNQGPPPGSMGMPVSQQPPQQPSMGPRASTGNFGSPGGPGSPMGHQGPGGPGGPGSPQGPGGGSPVMMNQPINPGDQQRPFGQQQQHNRSFSQGNMLNQPNNGSPQQFAPRNSAQGAPPYGNGSYGAPQLGALSFQGQSSNQRSSPQQPGQPFMPPDERRGSGPARPPGGPPPGQIPPAYGSPPGASPMTNMPPPSKPVFGVSLGRLYERDGFAVPTLVLKCMQTVVHFGLEVEGIYRVPGNKPHVEKLKSMADADIDNPALEFLDPAQFFYEIHNVTGLLKQFFRDLPDPLLTSEHYSSFIAAAQHKDPIVRRDSIHAIINSLPDPNYATLRALALHMHRVTENERFNRMDSHNLAVVLGPTLLGADALGDLGLQTQVVDTILQNTYQIFDDD